MGQFTGFIVGVENYVNIRDDMRINKFIETQ